MNEWEACSLCGGTAADAGPLVPLGSGIFVCQACQEEEQEMDRRIEEAKRRMPCTVCGRLIRPGEPARVEVSGDDLPLVWCSEHRRQREDELEAHVHEELQTFWHPEQANLATEEQEYLFLKARVDETSFEFRVYAIEPPELSPSGVVRDMPLQAGVDTLQHAGWQMDRWMAGMSGEEEFDSGMTVYRLRRSRQRR